MATSPTEEMILALAQSDAKFDGHEHWLGMPRTARERYLERARIGLTSILEVAGWQIKAIRNDNPSYWKNPILPGDLESIRETGKDTNGFPHKTRPLFAYKKD